MANKSEPLGDLTDAQLVERVKTLAGEERLSTAALIRALVELDRRRLYLGEGYPSLFAYCTDALHLSEDAAYNRTRAVRVTNQWPVVVEMIADGSVSLTAVRLLADVLTDANHREVLEAATHKSKREIEQLVAALAPRPDVPSSVRKVASPRPTNVVPNLLAPVEAPAAEAAPKPLPATPVELPPSRVLPLAPERYHIRITVDQQAHDNLRALQQLMRHQISSGDPAAIISRALQLMLDHVRRRRLGETTRPRKVSSRSSVGRYVPPSVRREVYRRDGDRCTFVGAEGRCREHGSLELHHVIPFADGGPTTVENLALRCRAHNAYEAEQHFGPLIAEGQSEGDDTDLVPGC